MQPLSGTGTRSAYRLLLAIAAAWSITLVLIGLFVELSGYLGPWRDLGEVLLSYWWIWLGPLLLVAGAISGLKGRYKWASIALIWVGCFSLTAMVLDLVIAVVHDAANPLIAKPPLGLIVFLIIGLAIALLADATAFRLSWKSN